MKKFILICLIAVSFLAACSKDEPAPVNTAVTYKYELILSAPLKDTTANAVVKYTDGNGVLQTATDLLPGATNWTKTITINSTTRPLPISFLSVGGPNGYFYLTNPGSVTARIYRNNIIAVNTTSTTVNNPAGYYYDNFALYDTLR